MQLELTPPKRPRKLKCECEACPTCRSRKSVRKRRVEDPEFRKKEAEEARRRYKPRTPEQRLKSNAAMRSLRKWRSENDPAWEENRVRTWRRFKETKPDYHRDYWLRGKYGITLEERDEMFESQNGMCPICKDPMLKRGTEGKSAVIDHDHITGAVRGLICNTCNKGIGYFRDDKVLLAAALEYLDA